METIIVLSVLNAFVIGSVIYTKITDRKHMLVQG